MILQARFSYIVSVRVVSSYFRQWIKAAHRNGVQILGTVITEVEPGEKICAEFLKV